MTPPLKVLIVDDEPLARRTVRRLLAADPEIEIVGECGDGRSALATLTRLSPDLVYLDISMPGLSGLELLDELKPAERPVIIFATAYDKFAVDAFKLHAVDYLLKPFNDARFRESLARGKRRARQEKRNDFNDKVDQLLSHFRRPTPAAPAAAAPAPERERAIDTINVAVGVERERLRLADIRWIEGQSDYVKFHLTTHAVMARRTMQSLEEQLPAAQFVRIHKSTIVNLRYVVRVRPALSGGWTVELNDGLKLRVSRTHRAELKERLAQ